MAGQSCRAIRGHIGYMLSLRGLHVWASDLHVVHALMFDNTRRASALLSCSLKKSEELLGADLRLRRFLSCASRCSTLGQVSKQVLS